MIARKVKLGVLFVSVLILVQIFAAVAYIFDLPTVYEPDKLVLFHLNHLYAYISILMVIRYLTFASTEVNKYLTLIIRLEILKLLTGVFLIQIASVISLGLVILYIALCIEIFKKENKEIYTINYLRPTVNASIIATLFGILLTFVYPRDTDVLGIAYLVNTVPFLFLIAYLIRVKSKTQPSNLLSHTVF